MKDYDPTMFKTKRDILEMSIGDLARETHLAKQTISHAENGIGVWQSTELLIGLVLDALAFKKGKEKEFARLERNWKNPKFRETFAQSLAEE